jgi:hypothetical protein
MRDSRRKVAKVAVGFDRGVAAGFIRRLRSG